MAEKKPDAELRDFAAVLLDMPQAHAKATRELNKLVAGVRETGKPGKITVTFKVAPGRADATMIEIQPVVTVGVPEQPLRGAGFYPDDDNNITKDDPSLLWRDEEIRDAPSFVVDTGTGEIKEAPKA